MLRMRATSPAPGSASSIHTPLHIDAILLHVCAIAKRFKAIDFGEGLVVDGAGKVLEECAYLGLAGDAAFDFVDLGFWGFGCGGWGGFRASWWSWVGPEANGDIGIVFHRPEGAAYAIDDVGLAGVGESERGVELEGLACGLGDTHAARGVGKRGGDIVHLLAVPALRADREGDGDGGVHGIDWAFFIRFLLKICAF